MKVLFSEGSSLTAREFLNALGPAGHWIEVLDSSTTCICRFSRWTKRIHPCPSSNIDPKGYLEAVNRVFKDGAFDVLLPTHEQAWLFAAAKRYYARSSSSYCTRIDLERVTNGLPPS